MAGISSGLLNVTNLTVTSGSSAGLNTINANVTNLTANNVSATNFTLNNANNITIGGQLFQKSQYADPVPAATLTNSVNSFPSANNRNSITMTGKDFNSSNYLLANDASGFAIASMVPKYITASSPGTTYSATAKNTTSSLNSAMASNVGSTVNYSQLKLPQFGAFNVDSPGQGLSGIQQTFQGVCDTNYIYMIWESYNSYLKSNALSTGTNLGTWEAILGFAADWNTSSALIIKLDRNTGKVIQAMPIGLMMDTAYLLAGSTTVAQSAVGPGVYYLNLDGTIAKDTSGNYLTRPVNGVNPSVTGYMGFQQVVGGDTWAHCGDDMCRGPAVIYADPLLGNCLYLTSMSQKYTSVYKVKCSDLSLVWRRTIDPIYISYQNAELTNAGRVMRELLVIPPSFGRANPLVVTTSTDNFSYSTVDLQDISKLWEYYQSGGTVQAWNDYGSYADNAPIWMSLMGPTPLTTSSQLPLTVFRQVNMDTSYNLLTCNGVKEVLSSDGSGFILDEDGNVSIEVYAPLTQGYVFTDGSANGITASCCKTTGVFTLMTGRTFTGFYTTNAIGGYKTAGTLGLQPYATITANMSNSYDFLTQTYELATFDFTSTNSNATQNGGVFDASHVYVGTIQNGPYANGNQGSSTITVPGYQLLNGVPDMSGNMFPKQLSGNDGSGNFQPVLKKIYRAQANNSSRLLDVYEASQLNIYAGGNYSGICYDTKTDVVVVPTGQFNSAGASIDKIFNKYMLSDILLDYPQYINGIPNNKFDGPLGTTSNGIYQVKFSDLSGTHNVWNSYFNDSSVNIITNNFCTAASFFRGIDSSWNYLNYTDANTNTISSLYNKNVAMNNLNSNLVKAQLNFYFQTRGLMLNSMGDPSNVGYMINSPNGPYANGNLLWIPGWDSSSNVGTDVSKPSAYYQNQWITNRYNAYWNKTIALRDNSHYGYFFNRAGACGASGFRVGNGQLLFSINLHGYDLADHSFMDYDFEINQPLSAFRSGGYNQDGISAVIVQKLTDSSNNSNKLLVLGTKNRTVVLDYNKLVDASANDNSGNNNYGGLNNTKTLKHVSGDTSLDFNQGCSINSWKSALIYEDNFNLASTIGVMNNGVSTNANAGGTLYLREQSSSDNRSGGYAPVFNYVPGKEVHGYLIDPKCLPVWAGTTTKNSSIQTAINTYLSSPIDTSGTKAKNKATMYYTGIFQYISSFLGTYSKSAHSYNLLTIVNNHNLNFDSSNTPVNVINYQYSLIDTYGSTFNNTGSTIYGGVVYSGMTNGLLDAFDYTNGYPINTSTPYVTGQPVPPTSSSPINIYNPEGQRVAPFMVDGCMYGYGGCNKFNNGGTPATKIFMWTPFGK